ncbi:MAG: penicillin-binding protein 2 [Proteobacteria bacterium]|nr:penicillin-binding protein 2 [Pseudomonadota bacterium]
MLGSQNDPMLFLENMNEDSTARALVVGRNRLTVVIWVMALAFSLLALRVLELNFMTKEDIRVATTKRTGLDEFGVKRSNIVDRNGVILATNLSTASLYVNPSEISDPKIAAERLATINSDWQYEEILDKISHDKQFVWIKRHLTPNEQQAVNNLGLPGVYFAADEKRIYPQGNLLSHILGFVDIDGNGISGVERYFHEKLARGGSDGKDLELSVDLRVQNILHDELCKAIETHSAIGGSGLIMDVTNGEVLAMVSLPDFDPHRIDKANDRQRFNQNTLGVYEMGSMMKLLTVAVGLDTDSIGVNDAFDVSQPLKMAKFTIHDYKAKGGSLSVPEILIYSSNLGTAKIVGKFGQQNQKAYLRNFGMLSKVDFELPEMASPLHPSEKTWREINMVTISYGHGIAMTPLHVAPAVAAMVNGGVLRRPTLIRRTSADSSPGRQVIKAETSEMMRKLMYMVAQYGSGRKAQVSGYYVGGKTGTSEKVINGVYNKRANLASFIGAFPINDPKYTVLIMVDEAKANKINGGYTTGGMIAAPIAGEVIKRVAPLLNITPQYANPGEDEIAKRLLDVRFEPRYKQLDMKESR